MTAKRNLGITTIIAYVFIAALALFTVLPFIILLVSSFSSESYIIKHGYSLFPKEFSLSAYRYIFDDPTDILNAYKVSIFVTVVGTAVSLFISSMAAYVLYRKEVKYRNALAFFLFFTTLFNGGLAPYYIMITRYLHLRDTILVLLLSPMFNVMYVLILRSFIKSSIPDAIIESSKIDGAGDFRIFIQMVLPLLGPALASIGLFTALNYWNDWWTPMMFVDSKNLYTLQYSLYKMLSMMNMTAAMSEHAGNVVLPRETFKLAMTVIAIGPIVLVYPFVQKYFVSGVTIGAVKG